MVREDAHPSMGHVDVTIGVSYSRQYGRRGSAQRQGHVGAAAAGAAHAIGVGVRREAQLSRAISM
jgi:hypothetical protein